MGLLDNKKTMYYLEDKVDFQQMTDALKQKLGDKYEVKLNLKGSVAKQMMGGTSEDYILVAKNAYHRTLIGLYPVPKEQSVNQERDETIIGFNKETLKGWLGFVQGQTGLIGSGIIRLIYGNSKAFDEAVEGAIKDSFGLKAREYNAGISSLWKKN